MKYYRLIVHGHTEYVMKDEAGVFHYAEVAKTNSWVKTIIDPIRVKQMKEITILDLIAQLKPKANV